MSSDIPICSATYLADLSAQTEFIIDAGPCLLQAVYVNEATNANPILICDDSIVSVEVPVSQSAGTLLVFENFKFDVNLKCCVDESIIGYITVIYVPQVSKTNQNVAGNQLTGEFISVSTYGLLRANGNYLIP